MLLTIDVGNTQTVIGLYEDEVPPSTAASGLVEHWRIATDAERTCDEHAVVLRDLLRSAGRDLFLDGVSICSGVPRVLVNLREMVDRYMEVEPVVVEPGVPTGMPVSYTHLRAHETLR